MKSTTPDPSYFQPWEKAFRRNAHLLINVGYNASRAKITTDELIEEHISEFIVCSIKEWMRPSRGRRPPPWCKFYSVHIEEPVSGKGKHGKSCPRTDIVIEGTKDERPEYVFEAKRLRTKGYGAGKYTGLGGMGCFTEGIYAERYNEAAMLGYVQSDTLHKWKERVKKSLTKNANKLYLQSPPYDEVVISDFPLEWVSEHVRNNGKSMRIYHVLLDCLPPTL